jgi:hypothetical protein
MGSVMSSELSQQTTVTLAAALVAALALTYSLLYTYIHTPGTATTTAKKPADKKSALSVKTTHTDDLQRRPIKTPSYTTIPGAFDVAISAPGGNASTKTRKARRKRAKAAAQVSSPSTSNPDLHQLEQPIASSTDPTPISTPPLRPRSRPDHGSASTATLSKPLLQSTTSIDTDGSWTRVESRARRQHPASSSDVTTTIDEDDRDDLRRSAPSTSPIPDSSSPLAEDDDHDDEEINVMAHRRPLAERLLPKPRKTGVEEYVSTSDAFRMLLTLPYLSQYARDARPPSTRTCHACLPALRRATSPRVLMGRLRGCA